MNKKQSSAILVIMLFILIVFIPAYASADEKVIKINPANVLGLVNMRSEITLMLEDLGYSWHPVLNESTQQRVKVAEKYDQYRMLFKLNNNNSLQIAVHIRQKDNMTGLHFSEVGTDHLSDDAMKFYFILKERSIKEFGDDNVSDNYSFFTP